MSERKIDKTELYRLLKEGKTGVECAKHFDVHPSAISLARRGLNVDVVKNVSLESAHEIVSQELNATAQLEKINRKANSILDELTGNDKVIDRLVRAVEGSLNHEGDPKKQREHIKRVIRQVNQDKEIALKAMREIRGQLNLQLEIFKALYDMEAVAAFQRTVLTSIQEVAPDVKDKIIEKLKQDKALRGSVKLVT